MDVFKTESEAVFAEYLDHRHLPYKYEESAGLKNPDFWIETEGKTVVCEIKQIEAKPPASKTGALNPYRKVIQALTKKAQQGKEIKGKHSYVVVIRKHHFWPIDEISVMGAMFGEIGITGRYDSRFGSVDFSEREITFGKDAVLQPEKNRGVSAVAILNRLNPRQATLDAEIARRIAPTGLTMLEKFEIIEMTIEELKSAGKYDPDERVPYLITFHNPFAYLGVGLTTFCGPYDKQWGRSDDGYHLMTEGIRRKQLVS
jgi:hypothetical protein